MRYKITIKHYPSIEYLTGWSQEYYIITVWQLEAVSLLFGLIKYDEWVDIDEFKMSRIINIPEEKEFKNIGEVKKYLFEYLQITPGNTIRFSKPWDY